MIDKLFIEKQGIKWQTSTINVLREYLQHLFLANFYEQKGAEGLSFKGGTALRIIHGSPRFSEDLDFSSQTASTVKIESLIENTLLKIQDGGISISISEAKTTSGGYFFDSESKIFNHIISTKLNISTRLRASIEVVMINSDFLPPYSLVTLKTEDLVEEKIQALLTRKKERDFFDLYFILRSRLAIKTVVNYKTELEKAVKNQKNNFADLKQFLPKSFWPIIKNLSENLINELGKLGN